MKKIDLIILILLSTLFSCKHELEKPSWDVNLLAPLIKSTLSIENIVGDSSVQVNPDSTISIVYRTNLYQFSLDSLIAIPDTNIIKVSKLDSLTLSTQSVVYPITLADVARSDTTGIGTIILMNHGNILPIPPLSGLSADSIDIDANQFFQTATVQSGYLDVKIENGFPININNLIYQLRNKSDASVVVQDTFISIPTGTVIASSGVRTCGPS